jgi:hypothetical protein
VSGNWVNVKQTLYFKTPLNVINAYIPSANHAETTIKKISADGGNKSKVIDSMNLEITCDKPQSSVSVEYEIKLENNRQTLSYSDNYVLLTNFLITPAVFKNGKPIHIYKSEFGDPYLYDMNNYEIKIKADKSYNVFGAGEKSDKVSAGNRVASFKAVNIRDFAIVLAKDAEVTSEKYGSCTVYYVNASQCKEYVKEALKFAEGAIGPYPYKELFVVNAPLTPNDGMEQSQMVMISDRCFLNGGDLKGVTYHELLHQWFYGIIATDQVDEPFLDEGLVCLTALFKRNIILFTLVVS